MDAHVYGLSCGRCRVVDTTAKPRVVPMLFETAIVDESGDMPKAGAYRHHFDSLPAFYALAGFKSGKWLVKAQSWSRRTNYFVA
jgi:hypothetical protein